MTKVDDPDMAQAVQKSQAEMEADHKKAEEERIRQQALKDERELNETFVKAVATLTQK